MLVPATERLSTSPSPAKVPPVIATVALARFALSGSETEAAPASVTPAAFSVYGKAVTRPASIGGSLTAVRLMVVVTVLVGLLALPSLSVQATDRPGSAPKLVGLRLVELNVTESRTCW